MASTAPPIPRPRNKRHGRQNSLFSRWAWPGQSPFGLPLDSANDLLSFDGEKGDVIVCSSLGVRASRKVGVYTERNVFEVVLDKGLVTEGGVYGQLHYEDCPTSEGTLVESDATLAKLKDLATVFEMSEKEVKVIPAPANQFHPFPRLPIELQLMIWSLALPEPTTIVLKAVPDSGTYFFEARNRGFIDNDTPWERCTTLLRTCFKSHGAYLKQYPYSLPFATRIKENKHRYLASSKERPKLPKHRTSPLHFSDKDKLYLAGLFDLTLQRDFWAFLKFQPWVLQVKNLVIDAWILEGLPTKKWIALLVHFKGVKMVEGILKYEGQAGKDGDRYDSVVKKIRDQVAGRRIKGVKMPEVRIRKFVGRGVWRLS